MHYAHRVAALFTQSLAALVSERGIDCLESVATKLQNICGKFNFVLKNFGLFIHFDLIFVFLIVLIWSFCVVNLNLFRHYSTACGCVDIFDINVNVIVS